VLTASYTVCADEVIDDEYRDMIEIKHDAMDHSLRIFDFARGFWLGLNRGLYNSAPSQEMERDCLSSKMRQRWQEAYGVWLGSEDVEEGVDFLSAMGDIIQLLANIDSCAPRKPLRDIMTFCTQEIEMVDDQEVPEFDDISKGGGKCDFSTIIENFSKNAFILMGKGSSMAQMIKEFPAKDPDQFLSEAMNLGEDLGTFMQAGLNFIEP